MESNLSPVPINSSWKAISKLIILTLSREMFDKTLVTVWSAPNYCYRCGNVAAILEFDENLNKNYKIFEAAPQESRSVPAKKPAPEYFL